MTLDPAVQRELAKRFDPGAARGLADLMATTELPLGRPHPARVHLAVIKPSEGNVARARRELAEAAKDWRDTLMAAGLENEDWRDVLRAHGFEVPVEQE